MPEDPIPEDPPAQEPAAPPSRLPQIPAPRQTPGPFASSQLASRSAVHLRTAGSALVSWWRAVTIQGLCVAVLWLIGLLLLHVPLAPVWALVAGLMTLVPNFGGVIALLGPAFSILVSQPSMYRLCFLLGLYAVIVVIDQLMLQPLIMKRVTRVPIWASILAPIVLGIVIPFWGILLAPPLLAVVYAFRRPRPPARISRQDP
ncbi:MAG TPA: AI-2E family transporter [Acidobacteriaceae bacterium]|nr:AI-2E family transporter [Acidobacteriaceae bacterium]